MNRKVYLTTPLGRRFVTLALCLLAVSVARTAAADDFDDLGNFGGRNGIYDYVQRQGFDLPDPAGPADVLRDGRIVALSGTEVVRETAQGSRIFVSLGALPGADFNQFGASFLKVAPDGFRIAVGNGGGAAFDHFQVGIFSLPSLTGTWFDANSFQAAWINERFLALTAGAFGSPSIVTAFDSFSSDPAHPSNRTIIQGIGGASGGIAFDRDDNLYTANGFATTGPSTTGTVKAFRRAQWRAALHGGPAVDFEASGTVIVTVLSAAPLEFDDSGNLFAGGSNFFGGGDTNFAAFISRLAVRSALRGHGPVDTNNPAQVRKVDPDPTAASSYNIIINPRRDEVYLINGGPHVFVFRAHR